MKGAPKLLAAIDDEWRNTEEPRGYLGASQLGKPCPRELWYGFRWALSKSFPPRILRLFQRGHREEEVFEGLMKDAGVPFLSRDPVTNKQFLVRFPNPHIGGHCDGTGERLPDLKPGDRFIGEWKTHNDKSFKQLVRLGVQESKMVHYVQMQLYMHRLGIEWGLYGAVNKNDDELYFELVPYHEGVAESYEQRGDEIVYALAPPARISSNPGWYECKWCDFHAVCHKGKPMEATCRSCTHIRPLTDGGWWCGQHDRVMSTGEQLAGCPDHVEINDE